MDFEYDNDNVSESSLELDSESEFEDAPAPPSPTSILERELKDNQSDASSTSAEPLNPAVMTARAYQMEMLEESLRQNIIATMDTGSGKTQVAVLRIQAELERSKKLIWFTAPTVALVDQQLERIAEQIPSIQCKRLCGLDNVDTWSTQAVWDAFLLNVGLVVSTPEVLFQACQHGFVMISSLSLLVIDEAHNCKGNAPGRRLMTEIYAREKARGREVPHILGLTASPVASSSLSDLEVLEQTLDARCKSPKQHREEFASFVNLPQMSIVSYGPVETLDRGDSSPAMASLQKASRGMRIEEDPSFLRLRADRTERGKAKFRDACIKQDTWARQKMRSFDRASLEIKQQLGVWAADYYIHKVITGCVTNLDRPSTAPGQVTFEFGNVNDEDKRYLAAVFRQIKHYSPAAEPTKLSRKAQKLVDILAAHEGDLRGIIFAKERTTVYLLAHLLRRHASLHPRLAVGSVVGSQTVKNNILEPVQDDSNKSLMEFRNGKINILVATSVLEEGIDVPACNLVICFDKPDTLKVFIQRRGRARMRESKLIMLLDENSTATAHEWQQLEREMKAKYEDDQRQLEVIRTIEEEEHPDYPILEVEGEDGRLARLTIDDAKSHLNHFCHSFSSSKFVDFSPYYIARMVGPEQDPKSPDAQFSATVQLPVSLPPGLREADSLRVWRSERNAFRDAAFQAYFALRGAGLVNDRLLPFKESPMFQATKIRPSFSTVRAQFDPWSEVAQAWETQKGLHRRVLTFSEVGGDSHVNLDLVLPVPIPKLQTLTFYWSMHAAWTLSMGEPLGYHGVNRGTEALGSNDIGTLVTLAYGHRGSKFAPTDGKRDMVCLVSKDFPLNPGGIASEDLNFSMFPRLIQQAHLIRDTTNNNHPFFFEGLLPIKPPEAQVKKRHKPLVEYPDDSPYAFVRDWPKRAGYFRQPKGQPQPVDPPSQRYHRIIPAEFAKVDLIPAIYARVGMLIPPLLHALGVYLVARELQENWLHKLELTDLSLVVACIVTPRSRMHVDYERIEFLGDCILKLCATSNCLAQHPDWPEGYLSLMKVNYISNAQLAQAAVDFGLDRFIITDTFNLKDWRPLYVEDHLEPSKSITATREMPTKTLADVVEALVGACYLDGGLPKALKCLALFMPEEKWHSIEQARKALDGAAPRDITLHPSMEPLETLIGYTFKNKALLVEAMTHASYNLPGTHASLERLEFFGDSLVEFLVVRRLFPAADPAPLPHWRMHLIRTALVNGDLMGFLVMGWGTRVRRRDVVAPTRDPRDIEIRDAEVELPLWSFMRYVSAELAAALKAAEGRFAALRGPIREAIEGGGRYPWALLARLQAHKFYSDLFESLLGAIYVDSGSFEECDRYLERAGLFPVLKRILKNEIDCLHPKEELNRLAVAESVEYIVDTKEVMDDGSDGEDEAVPGNKTFTCKLLIGERLVAEIDNGVSRDEAKISAAAKAVRAYHENGGKWYWQV